MRSYDFIRSTPEFVHRNERNSSKKKLLGCIAALARCGLQTQQRGLSVGLSVCLSVVNDREPCKNG